jgi:hypothetical protein
MVGDLFKLIALSGQAIAWAKRARSEDPAKRSRAVIAQVKARNWAIVSMGSLVAIFAGALDVIHYAHEH